MAFALPTIDLFAGAGGMGIGAQRAGSDLRLSIDNDYYSCETLRTNHKLHHGSVLHQDVTSLTGDDLRLKAGLSKHQDLLVIGGAPCQPFSKAAYWVDKGDEAAYRRAKARGETPKKPSRLAAARPDSRRTLVHEFLRLVCEADASAFVFENVPSILHPRNKHIFEALRADAKNAGYKTTTVLAKATDYGAAQSRRRVFLIGSKQTTPLVPETTHSEVASATKPAWTTAGDVLTPLDDDALREEGESVEGRWADHLRAIPAGMNYKFHTAWAGHPTPTFETETRYWNFLLKLSPHLPSWTIPASPGPWTGPFHWSSRRLRIPELAALQDFPDGYTFFGSRRERVRQIGNAVPSSMAKAMVNSAIQSLNTSEV